MKYFILSVFVIILFLGEINSYLVGDLEPAESQLQTEFKKGNGREFQEAEHSAEGEKGAKGFAERHEQESGKKGYHNSEGNKKQYAEGGKAIFYCYVFFYIIWKKGMTPII